jgi:DNA-binding CsgD family transcriptional regulator
MGTKRRGKIKGSGKANLSAASLSPDRARCNGYPFLSQGAAAFSPEAWQEIRRGLKLSARELQIVQGIFDDKVEFAIATGLGISINTVHTELHRLRHKLDAADRVTLVLCVVEEFLRQTTSDKSTLPAICRNHSSGRCPLLHAVTRSHAVK